MTYAFLSLTDHYPRLRVRHVAPIEKRTRSIRVARTNSELFGKRANPQFRAIAETNTVLGQLFTSWRNRRAQRRWQRDLRELDDRLLRDVGISRADVEQAAGRPGSWI